MQLSLSKKIIFYIFLIIFLSTLNSKHISEIRFKNIDQITVIGLQENERQDLLKDLQLLNLNNIFFLKNAIFFFVDFGPISIPYPPEP